MKRAAAACTAIVAILFAATLDAQRLAPAVLQSSTTRSSFFPSGVPLDPPAPSHWLEGAIIGGLITGAIGASWAGAFCGDRDSGGSGRNCFLRELEGFVIGAVPGFTIGGIIGGVIRNTPADSARAP